MQLETCWGAGKRCAIFRKISLSQEVGEGLRVVDISEEG